MRNFGLAAILAVMLPVTGQACDMAYASCRHNDSRTDTNRSDKPKPNQKKDTSPAFGWPGLQIEDVGGMKVVVGLGVIVSYDKNGHIYLRDRTGRIFVLTDPSKRPASKPHATMTVARALQSAPPVATLADVPAVAQGEEQSTASNAAGSDSSSSETDTAGTAPNEAASGASDSTGTATSEQSADTGPTEASAGSTTAAGN